MACDIGAINGRSLPTLALIAVGLFASACTDSSTAANHTNVGEEAIQTATCFVTGAHRQLCQTFERPGEGAEALPFYACFEGATCGPVAANDCSWTMTPEIIDCLQNSPPPTNRIPHADFHVHWDSMRDTRGVVGIFSPYESLAYIDSLGITSGLLITNTYRAHQSLSTTVGELLDINRRYSEILSSHPHAANYQLLCGVSFQRDDAVDLAARCLELPKVRGIKLRDFTVRRPEDLHKFETLVGLASARDSLVLSHFGNDAQDVGTEDGASSPGAMEDVQRIVAVMDRLPRATLIIAHSGVGASFGWKDYAWIGEHYRASPQLVPNIYIETSDSIASAEGGGLRPNARAWIESWRPFGMDRVIFGSDFATLPREPFAALEFLASTDALSPAEALDVTRLTGERLARTSGLR